eukprot:562436-Prorocentrum_minimum.AAC.1
MVFTPALWPTMSPETLSGWMYLPLAVMSTNELETTVGASNTSSARCSSVPTSCRSSAINCTTECPLRYYGCYSFKGV